MDALVAVCRCKTNANMFWAWMLMQSDVLGKRTLLVFGLGAPTNHARLDGLRMDALTIGCAGTRTFHGVGMIDMHAPVTVCTWNANVSTPPKHKSQLNRMASYKRRFHNMRLRSISLSSHPYTLSSYAPKATNGRVICPCIVRFVPITSDA